MIGLWKTTSQQTSHETLVGLVQSCQVYRSPDFLWKRRSDSLKTLGLGLLVLTLKHESSQAISISMFLSAFKIPNPNPYIVTFIQHQHTAYSTQYNLKLQIPQPNGNPKVWTAHGPVGTRIGSWSTGRQTARGLSDLCARR